MSAGEQRKYDESRWERNQVAKLAEGFTLVSDGRSGRLYFREGERFIEVYLELAGSPKFDVVVELAGLKNWISLVTLSREPVSQDDERDIQCEMEKWLQSRKIRFSTS